MRDDTPMARSRRSGRQVWVPVTVGCGCLLHFGPTLDNGINQPLREVCKHKHLWAGTYFPATHEAIVGRVVERRVDEASYAVEPETFAEMYEAMHGVEGRNDHGNLL